MKRTGIIKLDIDVQAMPTVELDSTVNAAYVRFSNSTVERTEEIDCYGCVVTADFDSKGKIVGIELVGVQEFTINALLNKAGIHNVPDAFSRNARYIPAAMQSA